MGWGTNNRESIAATDVVSILRAERYHSWDTKKALAGKQAHKRILDSLTEQINPTLPGFDVRSTAVVIPVGRMVGREQTISIAMSDKVNLSVAPDATIWDGTQLSCVEIKPSFDEYHLLQLMYECMAANEVYGGGSGAMIQGLLYLYRSGDSVRQLKGGGRECWEAGKRIAVLASEIRAKANSSLMKVAGIPITNPKERAVYYRRELDTVWDSVMSQLKNDLQ